jgi:hypothetical protein
MKTPAEMTFKESAIFFQEFSAMNGFVSLGSRIVHRHVDEQESWNPFHRIEEYRDDMILMAAEVLSDN